MTKEPHAIIEEIYSNPVLESSPMQMNYSNPDFDLKSVKDARDIINTVVQEKRSNLGLDHIRELNLQSNQAGTLRDEIKNDVRWQDGLKSLVSTLAPDIYKIDFATQISAITLPWWNAAVLARQSGTYDSSTSGLSVDAMVSHSYITQLTRSLKIPSQHKTDAMSISNILITEDNFIVLGLRGGHSYSNTYMVVPAGSVEYHSGKNPLFETLYAEHFEEVGLSKDQIKSAEFVGRIYDSQAKCSLYVSRTKIDMSFSMLENLWESAIDNREHLSLKPIENHPQQSLINILSRQYHPECANPQSISLTAPENIKSILPPAAASLLTHHAQHEGGLWYKKAECMLNGNYVFRE